MLHTLALVTSETIDQFIGRVLKLLQALEIRADRPQPQTVRHVSGITRCSTLLPIRGSAGMPSSLSGHLPLAGKDRPAISRLNLRELTLKPAFYLYVDPSYRKLEI